MCRPDVLLIFVDQMRDSAWSGGGNSLVKTPNLDKIREEGVTYTNAYSPCPSCVPARACALTGLTPVNVDIIGMGYMQRPMKSDYEHTLPKDLAELGYDCVGIGKMHFNPQRALQGYRKTIIDESGRKSGEVMTDYMQYFQSKMGHTDIIGGMNWNGYIGAPYKYDEELHQTHWTADEALKYLDFEVTAKPFFLKVSFARPHSPYDAPKRLFDYYMEQDLDEPLLSDWDSKMFVDTEDKATWRGKKPDYQLTAPQYEGRIDMFAGEYTLEECQAAKAGYYGNITFIDEQIGRIVAKLKQMGRYDNTMIIFVSDHGDMLGDHYLWRKTYAYESSVHIPLLMRYPKASLIGTSDKIATLYDLLPTIVNAVGGEVNHTCDGIDLARDERDYLHGEHCQSYSYLQDMQYIVDKEWKYIWLPKACREQLFDMVADRAEMKDLSGIQQYQEVLLRYRALMAELMAKRNINMLNGEGGLVDFADAPAFNRM